MMNLLKLLFAAAFIGLASVSPSQEAKVRWERMNLIRQEKMDIILPRVMRENDIDMWIVMVKRGHKDPLHADLGGGNPNDKWGHGKFIGYYIFTDRGGERIERAVLGIHGYTLEHSGVYDIFGVADDVKDFVRQRDPEHIGINMSDYIGAADGLSYSCYQYLARVLGPEYEERFVSAEKLVADFRSHRVTSEIVVFGEAAELTRQIMERALSDEVVTPGVTTRDDVGWWIQDRMLELGLPAQSSLPSVIYPERAGSKDYIIQRGDLLSLDWGARMMNFTCDVKRLAYVSAKVKRNPRQAYGTLLNRDWRCVGLYGRMYAPA